MTSFTKCYCVPHKTELRYGVKKCGDQTKDKQWMQIEGVPCKIVSYNDESKMFTLNSLASADPNSNFQVSRTEVVENFTQVDPTEEGFLKLEKYPEPIHVSEFEKRSDIKSFKVSINKLKNKKSPLSPSLKKLFDDKLDQLFVSQGSAFCVTIPKYEEHKKGVVQHCHKRIGDPIFNRNSRSCPPIDISYEEFEKSPSFPAPLGIRPKDCCLPSKLLDTVKEMINQIMNFEHISEEDFAIVQKEFSFVEKKAPHCCKYCGKTVDIEQYSSEYKSSDNYIEICHRDPEGSFTTENMYWGHGECNRRQGGYSEFDVIKDGYRLAYMNGYMDKATYDMLMEKLPKD